MKNKILIMLSVSLLLPNLIYADCTKEEINAFKDIEEEFTVTSFIEGNTKENHIKFINPNPEKYGFKLISYNDNKTTTVDLKNIKEKEFSLPETPGDYTVEIHGITESCDIKLKTINIKLSKYNIYSEDPLCSDIPEFVLCNPEYDKDIDYDTFVSRVNTYKQTLVKKAIQEEKEKENKIDEIVEYLKENIVKIIIIIIFIIAITITSILTIKSIVKRRRLE